MVNWRTIPKGGIIHCKLDNEGQKREGHITAENTGHYFIILSGIEYNCESKFILAVPISSQNLLANKFKALEPINDDDLQTGHITQSYVLCDRFLRISKNTQEISSQHYGQIKPSFFNKILKRMPGFILFDDGSAFNIMRKPCHVCGCKLRTCY